MSLLGSASHATQVSISKEEPASPAALRELTKPSMDIALTALLDVSLAILPESVSHVTLDSLFTTYSVSAAVSSPRE